ncbi:LysR family transcriptional regulator [Photobacterium sp. 2_MG-2023]|uniref:LysR family transcriptional regulator n=1 Tax=Photobacterium sp. 2_MG-2023 TaxID=3062663 RepID=UPI0026E204B1|nr:LysR family transcriptional regulator [Photobacterium sp. 2_MG-2023]MDO6581766.1 LysR family transcriptional regulator [Photobacterium sp. 2_MG-2023]
MDTNRLIVLMPEMATFVTVVDEGSFSKSAIRLGVAPSSVSRSVSRLENALQEKLIQRTTRQMRLTPVGKDVYRLCREMLQSARLAVKAAQSTKGEISGLLRVAAPKALSRQVLAPIILDFIEHHPKVQLQLKVADHVMDPVGDEVDLIIRISEKPVDGLVAKVLGQTRLVLCATPAYLAQHGIPSHPEEISHHNCICLGETAADRTWRFTNNQQTLAFQVRGTLTVNHSEIRRDAVLRHLGISIFPAFTISTYLESGQVCELLPDWHINGNYQGQIVAQYPQSKYLPNQIRAFLDHLQYKCSQIT